MNLSRSTIRFIINPISGGLNKKHFPQLINRVIDPQKYFVEICFSQSTAHTHELTLEAIDKKVAVIAAVGGDGTVNNIASHLTGTDTLLAIVPKGSGNGLSRHLKIPMNEVKALETINRAHSVKIDSGMANEHFFINVAGAGFDAHVSHQFAHAPQRGFKTYAQITLHEFKHYACENYTLQIDKEHKAVKAFIICVANGSQYGNNAFIAPTALVNDGYFDLTVLKPFSPWKIPQIGLKLFNKTLHTSNLVYTYRFRDLTIIRENEGVFNIDGEAIWMPREIHIKLKPSSIQIIVPQK